MAVTCFLVEEQDDGTFALPGSGQVWPYESALPPGAMWFSAMYLERCTTDENASFWREHFKPGPDGKVLLVVLPNGRIWVIDGCANNCGKRKEFPTDTHHCWIRAGTAPKITVSKNGDSCQAGAGSIHAGDYHGFLQNGILT
jgi:hypothetical protein